jgi:hypothetical protein
MLLDNFESVRGHEAITFTPTRSGWFWKVDARRPTCVSFLQCATPNKISAFVRINRQRMAAAAAAAALREEFTDIGVCVGQMTTPKGIFLLNCTLSEETRKIKDMDVVLRSVRQLHSG